MQSVCNLLAARHLALSRGRARQHLPLPILNRAHPGTRHMKPFRSALLPAALLVLVCAGSGCKNMIGFEDNHWNIGSLPRRVAYHGLGFRKDLDESYKEYRWEATQATNLTLRRHFLNNNPLSPFQPYDSSIFAPRPPHSFLPNPIAYIHLDPLGAVIGTIETGGFSEFGEGVGNTFRGKYRSAPEPPPVSRFRVRNRTLR